MYRVRGTGLTSSTTRRAYRIVFRTQNIPGGMKDDLNIVVEPFGCEVEDNLGGVAATLQRPFDESALSRVGVSEPNIRKRGFAARRSPSADSSVYPAPPRTTQTTPARPRMPEGSGKTRYLAPECHCKSHACRFIPGRSLQIT